MRMLVCLAGFAFSLAAASQEIYRWVDKDGIVHYADQPGAPNAELITVIEPNAYDSADTAIATSAARDESAEPPVSPYFGLSIASPLPDEVFFGADAVVSATANLEGTLRPEHSLVFFLNGERRSAEGLATEFTGLARGSYFLRASVLDENGEPMLTSEQVSFHVRQPSINSPQSPQARPPAKPGRPPRPTPTPTPRPATPPRS